MTSAPRGVLVALEGGDGAGKSTLAAALAVRVRAAGREAVTTREPGGTALGERIRALVAGRETLAGGRAELLLFEAARAQLVEEVLRPQLARGAVVICDRFTASSVAYQGYGRGLGREVVERANAVATGGLEPDLTLLLDLPAEMGLARRTGAGGSNHFDHATLEFHERVRAGYRDLAREAGERWRVIDATRPPEAVAADAWAAVEALLNG